MAERYIDTLRANLPEVFEDREALSSCDDFIFVELTSPSEPYPDSPLVNVREPDDAHLIDQSFFDPDIEPEAIWNGMSNGVGILGQTFPGSFPGALTIPSVRTPVAPPDSLAFYLPYHHFHPTWWGVYLLLDGVAHLASWLYREARHRGQSAVTPRDCWLGARLFLFYHEIQYHNVESFATRLEVTHRQPLYKSGFQAFYAMTAGTPACLEESLAEANAWRQTTNPRFFGASTLSGMKDVLIEYIRVSPPGYKEGLDHLTGSRFTAGQNLFAEQNHQISVTPKPAGKRPAIWNSAKYLFRGFNDKAKGRAKYVISKHSPLAAGSRYAPDSNRTMSRSGLPVAAVAWYGRAPITRCGSAPGLHRSLSRAIRATFRPAP